MFSDGSRKTVIVKSQCDTRQKQIFLACQIQLLTFFNRCLPALSMVWPVQLFQHADCQSNLASAWTQVKLMHV